MPFVLVTDSSNASVVKNAGPFGPLRDDRRHNLCLWPRLTHLLEYNNEREKDPSYQRQARLSFQHDDDVLCTCAEGEGDTAGTSRPQQAGSGQAPATHSHPSGSAVQDIDINSIRSVGPTVVAHPNTGPAPRSRRSSGSSSSSPPPSPAFLFQPQVGTVNSQPASTSTASYGPVLPFMEDEEPNMPDLNDVFAPFLETPSSSNSSSTAPPRNTRVTAVQNASGPSSASLVPLHTSRYSPATHTAPEGFVPPAIIPFEHSEEGVFDGDWAPPEISTFPHSPDRNRWIDNIRKEANKNMPPPTTRSFRASGVDIAAVALDAEMVIAKALESETPGDVLLCSNRLFATYVTDFSTVRTKSEFLHPIAPKTRAQLVNRTSLWDMVLRLKPCNSLATGSFDNLNTSPPSTLNTSPSPVQPHPFRLSPRLIVCSP